MKFRRHAAIALIASLLSGSPASSQAANAFDRTTLGRLAALKMGDSYAVDAFPAGPTGHASIRFQKVTLYASDAHIYLETSNGREEIARSDRTFLRGYSDDGAARVALVINRDGTFASGAGSGPEGSFALHGGIGKDRNLLRAQALDTLLPSGATINFDCANEREPMDAFALASRPAAIASQMTLASHNLRFAVVALDTDSKFMSIFSNNTTAAGNWIAGMFNTMNLMYERDLLVQLRIGTTIFRTLATDPYTAFTQGATPAQLDTFASYWKNNYSSGAQTITRSFAALLSGAYPAVSGCGYSGFAWVNQYCQNGFAQNADTVGSYSVDQVCASTQIDPDGSFDALLLGHELGHNFGAYHTHCTNASSGVPTASNFIDQCHSGESVVYNNVVEVCYSGATSCPAAGAGTIMSYCNFTGSGCASGTQNLLQFNLAQATALQGYVAAAPAGCLNTTDDIFFSLFE